MRLVDNRFWRLMQPYILRIFQYPPNHSPTASPEELTRQVIEACSQIHCDLFLHLPGIQDEPWPHTVTNSFSHDVERLDAPWTDYVWFRLNGTTFSGHPTKTTLGNTLRSLTYAYYYAERAGVSDAW